MKQVGAGPFSHWRLEGTQAKHAQDILDQFIIDKPFQVQEGNFHLFPPGSKFPDGQIPGSAGDFPD